jgi:hypothetical protein
MPISVFFSYSHRDEPYREQLEKHLKILSRSGTITEWHDRKIPAGSEWEAEIDRELESADIILLLISPDFVASDYCWSNEMTKAMQRHDASAAVVLPIMVRPVHFGRAPFAKLQMLPKDARPVSSWPDQDEAWVEVSRAIELAADRLSRRKQNLEVPATDPILRAVDSEQHTPTHVARSGSTFEYRFLILTSNEATDWAIYKDALANSALDPLVDLGAYNGGQLNGWEGAVLSARDRSGVKQIFHSVASRYDVNVLVDEARIPHRDNR